MSTNQHVDSYIEALPLWQQHTCQTIRQLIHQADPEIVEEIKFTNRPYFTHQGNVCALLAAKDHVNVFIYDPIAPDPTGLINQGQGNATARAIQLREGAEVDAQAFIALIQAVVANNLQGGWHTLKHERA